MTNQNNNKDRIKNLISVREEEINIRTNSSIKRKGEFDRLEMFLRLPEALFICYYEKQLLEEVLYDIEQSDDTVKYSVLEYYLKVWTQEIFEGRWEHRNSSQWNNIKNSWKYKAKANLIRLFNI